MRPAKTFFIYSVFVYSYSVFVSAFLFILRFFFHLSAYIVSDIYFYIKALNMLVMVRLNFLADHSGICVISQSKSDAYLVLPNHVFLLVS